MDNDSKASTVDDNSVLSLEIILSRTTLPTEPTLMANPLTL